MKYQNVLLSTIDTISKGYKVLEMVENEPLNKKKDGSLLKRASDVVAKIKTIIFQLERDEEQTLLNFGDDVIEQDTPETTPTHSTQRVFAYLRVSTADQTVDNQVLQIKQAGYNIPPHRIISEVVSGGVCASERKEFKNLIDNKLESGDKLVVVSLSRLGRNMTDVLKTIEDLQDRGVEVVSLDLPITDLTSSSGKLMLGIMATVANFERELIRDRTKAGVNRAKAEGKKLGRPTATKVTEEVQKLKKAGHTQKKVSELVQCSLRTVKRHWNVDKNGNVTTLKKSSTPKKATPNKKKSDIIQDVAIDKQTTDFIGNRDEHCVKCDSTQEHMYAPLNKDEHFKRCLGCKTLVAFKVA